MEHNKVDPSFRKLYPHLSEKELFEAQERFGRYIELSLGIFERVQSDPNVLVGEQHALHASRRGPRRKTTALAGGGRRSLEAELARTGPDRPFI